MIGRRCFKMKSFEFRIAHGSKMLKHSSTKATTSPGGFQIKFINIRNIATVLIAPKMHHDRVPDNFTPDSDDKNPSFIRVLHEFPDGPPNVFRGNTLSRRILPIESGNHGLNLRSVLFSKWTDFQQASR